MNQHSRRSNAFMFAEWSSAALILLFVYTAGSKLANFTGFTETLSAAPVIGRFAPILAWLLPAVEIGIALLLFIPALRSTGLYASLVLLLLFTAYLVAVLVFTHLPLPCSCGGVLRYMSWKQHIIFNGLFILLTALGIMFTRLRDVSAKTSYAPA